MRDSLFCLRRLTAIAYRCDRRRFLIGAALVMAGGLATPIVAVALKALINAVGSSDAGDAVSWALLATAAVIGELMLGHFAHLYYFEVSELTEERLTRRLLRLVNGTPGLERNDDPAFADRVELLRQDVVTMRTTVQSGMQLSALVLQLLATAVVLALLSPVLLLLLVVAAVPIITGRRAEQLLIEARERIAPQQREIRHLRALSSSPGSQKEVRLSGSAWYFLARQRELLTQLDATMARAYRRHGVIRGAGQVLFALAYAASVFWVFVRAHDGAGSLGDVVLVVVLATQISVQMASGLELLTSVHQSAAGLRRLDSLDVERAVDFEPRGTVDAPLRLQSGIELRDVRFRYPGSDREVLTGVTLSLPPGTSVAVVGENGAGKSTLIKLLMGLYRPTQGQILINGVDIDDVRPETWHERTSALFQDFARLEFSLQHSVGVGHLPDVESPTAVSDAMRRAGAEGVLAAVGDHDALIGNSYGDGRDLSGGQWQVVGLARTLMRSEPLLLCLDEPGHSLDAQAEQNVYDAYQATAQHIAREAGGITIFVSHRLSTARLADVVVVLEGGGVAEFGTHDALLAGGGHYAELYGMQAKTYTP